VSLPTPHVVLVKPYAGTTEDAHGNTTTVHGASREWRVHAIAPGASEEPRKPNRDLSVIAWTIYGPATNLPGEHDLIALPWAPDEWYDVEGRPDDWTHGPWTNPVAGAVVELRRPEG